jgi:hypothetical protein
MPVGRFRVTWDTLYKPSRKFNSSRIQAIFHMKLKYNIRKFSQKRRAVRNSCAHHKRQTISKFTAFVLNTLRCNKYLRKYREKYLPTLDSSVNSFASFIRNTLHNIFVYQQRNGTIRISVVEETHGHILK